jgi:hypothetical protein
MGFSSFIKSLPGKISSFARELPGKIAGGFRQGIHKLDEFSWNAHKIPYIGQAITESPPFIAYKLLRAGTGGPYFKPPKPLSQSEFEDQLARGVVSDHIKNPWQK